MRRQGRRSFLQSLGVSAALAPFLPRFDAEAEAQSGEFPRRLLLVFTGNGTLADQFWPTGSETGFSFGAGSITEPLAPFRDKLLFPQNLRRLTSGSGAHEKNMGGLWTASELVEVNGYPTGPSVDQIIAQSLSGSATFDSLQFGVQCDSFNTGGNKAVLKSMTYSGRNQVLTPEDDPLAVFDKLMLGEVAEPAPSSPDPELARIRARKQSVLDAVRGDLQSLTPRLDRSDRHKLEQHLEGLRDIERRLQEPLAGGMASGCFAPDAPDSSFADAEARKANANFPAIMAVQNRLAVAALACDRTRVASLQWSRSFSPIVHEWADVHTDHHTISHKTDPESLAQLLRINRWYGERFAELLGELDAVAEGDGTLLDNTVVVWGNEAVDGNHDASSAVFLLAGGCGGALRTGRLVDAGGYDWSQLLVTLCHALGVTSVDRVGDLDMKSGDVPLLRS
jgi:hypothetical protein